jgi:glycosyltransferase involved in cell wall biosynthesis
MINKIAQIGPYPPPETGWSVRIKELRLEIERSGNFCKVLNIGSNRKVQNDQYIGVQNGLDYILKLFFLRVQGYRFHIHGNAQAVKGPLLCLIANVIAVLTLKRAIMTFHGGYSQLFFPKKNAGRMLLVIYLNFLFSKKIICNDQEIKRLICNYGPLINFKKVYPIPAFSTQYLEFEKVDLPEHIQSFIKTKDFIVVSYIAVRNGFHLETLCEYIERASDKIAFVITGVGKVEDTNLEDTYQKLIGFEQTGKIIMIQSLSHDAFMSLLTISDIYLRTPDSDGVSSSVLEAMSSGAVVVASENGRRPEGVITYTKDNSVDLENKINMVLNDLQPYKSSVTKPLIKDTVSEEVKVLFDEI